MSQKIFGRSPSGARQERITRSPHYRDGKFQNEHFTPDLTEGHNLLEVTCDFLFKKNPRRTPEGSIPSEKTDLAALHSDENVLVWFGHSSYFLQIDGKKILVDPVFSGNASPIPRSNRSFKGTDRYTIADMPTIDYLLITHDHYDHLDYETVSGLKNRVGKVICGLGVGAHLEYWGYAPGSITELDWYESAELDTGFRIHAAPARHFSGRGFIRNRTVWLSFVLRTPSMNLYLGGDSGYDTHFAEIGARFGPFDLAILENGQYDPKWKYIHMLPEEVVQAAKDLRAAKLLPVHSSKFALANHAWNEPLQRVSEAAHSTGMPLLTPLIGEKVDLNDNNRQFTAWWENVR